MKTYRVRLSDEALAAAEAYLRYIDQEQGEPLAAWRWWQKATEAIGSLSRMPDRCPPAPENEHTELTIRMLRVDRCLFLFTVEEDSAVVQILKFRHGSQQPNPLD